MSRPTTPSVEDLIVDAATAVAPVDPVAEPWTYGWSVEEYRRSGGAVLPGPDGPVTIGLDRLGSYERSVQQLLREPAVLDRWDRRELWGLVATLVVAASGVQNPRAFATANVRRIRDAEPSLVVLPVANVTWAGDPIEIASGVVGRLDDRFVAEVERVAAGRADLSTAESVEWVGLQTLISEADHEVAPSRGVVVAAWWTKAQMQLATHLATRWLEDICCLGLLLQRTGRTAPWTVSGDHNRLGPRGLRPDRATLTKILGRSPEGSLELSFQPLVLSPMFGASRPVHWYSADPLPLNELLLGAGPDRLASAALGESAVPRRLRVAARWYADGQWSSEADDAALALGVALDALVGSKAGLPGRLMAQRFALLEPDPMERRDRLARYNDVYSVRSAIAHGGESRRLAEEGFVLSVADDVRWAADRLIAFSDRFSSSTEGDIDRSFEELALGTINW